MNPATKKKNDLVREYIISCIDGEAYDENPQTDKEKLAFLKKTFMAEVGRWRIPQVGFHEALKDWFQGLPTACTVEFYNYEIIKLGINWGYLSQYHSEAQADKWIERYWDLIPHTAQVLMNKFKV